MRAEVDSHESERPSTESAYGMPENAMVIQSEEVLPTFRDCPFVGRWAMGDSAFLRETEGGGRVRLHRLMIQEGTKTACASADIYEIF